MNIFHKAIFFFFSIDLKSLDPIRKESEKGNKEAKKFLERIKSQI